ncbi:MAG: hypothetical protein KGL92_07545 [Gammaproteobacteria bacterium]|nr:hypothetical protein [Gammaproteobacteria bacterium]
MNSSATVAQAPAGSRADAGGSVTFAVVAFSTYVQGLTMTPLLRKLGQFDQPPGALPDAER